MKYGFIVGVRNDQAQILVLERSPVGNIARVCFPEGSYENSSKVRPDTLNALLGKLLERQVLSDTGLKIGGIHLHEVVAHGSDSTHCFTAFVTGGKLHPFPTTMHFGASWMSPSLALTLRGITAQMEALLRGLLWLQSQRP